MGRIKGQVAKFEMTRKVITLPRAEADISEAYFYFEKKRLGLGEKFIARIDDVYNRIREMPEAYAVISKTDLRQVKLHQFPFVIGYLIEDENRILVLGVLHGSRNPQDWITRMR